MSLPERVDGAPNFRRVRLLFGAESQTGASSASAGGLDHAPLVYGTGMPTVDGYEIDRAEPSLRVGLMSYTAQSPTSAREDGSARETYRLDLNARGTRHLSVDVLRPRLASESADPLLSCRRLERTPARPSSI